MTTTSKTAAGRRALATNEQSEAAAATTTRRGAPAMDPIPAFSMADPYVLPPGYYRNPVTRELYLAPTQRADGTWRKPRRVREIPTVMAERYVVPGRRKPEPDDVAVPADAKPTRSRKSNTTIMSERYVIPARRNSTSSTASDMDTDKHDLAVNDGNHYYKKEDKTSPRQHRGEKERERGKPAKRDKERGDFTTKHKKIKTESDTDGGDGGRGFTYYYHPVPCKQEVAYEKKVTPKEPKKEEKERGDVITKKPKKITKVETTGTGVGGNYGIGLAYYCYPVPCYMMCYAVPCSLPGFAGAAAPAEAAATTTGGTDDVDSRKDADRKEDAARRAMDAVDAMFASMTCK